MAIDMEEEYEKIYRYCYFHVKDAYLAEDLTQETFLRYLNRNPGLFGGKRLAYLYTIARNLCTDAYRERQTEELKEEPVLENAMEHLEVRMDMKQAVNALKREEQELLLLRYHLELSVREAADILGISRFAFYRREREVLKQLKIRLEGGKEI